MGAWGPGPFENDDALDYLDMFEESGGLAATLALGDGEDELEAPDGSMIVAAAEVVACLLGRPRDQDTLELVHELVDATAPPTPPWSPPRAPASSASSARGRSCARCGPTLPTTPPGATPSPTSSAASPAEPLASPGRIGV